jgi:hypothetical protein
LRSKQQRQLARFFTFYCFVSDLMATDQGHSSPPRAVIQYISADQWWNDGRNDKQKNLPLLP